MSTLQHTVCLLLPFFLAHGPVIPRTNNGGFGQENQCDSNKKIRSHYAENSSTALPG